MSSSKKTRLMIIAPQLILGGAETLVKDVFLNINRDEFEVRLCVFNYGGQTSIYNELTQKQNEIVVLDKANCRLTTFMLRLIKQIKRYRPDVITCWGWMTFYVRVATLIAGYPRIVPQINSSDIYVTKQRTFVRIIMPLIVLVERFFARLDAGRIAISDAAREYTSKIMHLPKDRVSVVYCGIDTEFFRPLPPDTEFKKSLSIPQNAKVISIVGRLVAVKNHKMFLRVARNICKERKDVFFLVVGPDWPCDYDQKDAKGKVLKNIDVLKALAEDYGIAKHILFLGSCRNVRQILSITDVFAMTSISEGLNNSVLEALASEKPVVATAVGGMKESIVDGECGYYVSSDDDEAMADRILDLLNDPEKMERFSKSARKRALEKFTIPEMIRKKEEIYKQAAKGDWSLLNLLRSGFAFIPHDSTM